MAPRDRTTGLVLLGVLEIVLGILCALLIPLTLWAAAFSASVDPSAAASLTVRRLAPGLSLHALGAAVLIWLGAGSVRARRWAAALWPVVGWVWLAIGLSSVAAAAAVAPALRLSVGYSIGMPDAWATAVIIGVLGAGAAVGVVLPAFLVRFYRRQDVRTTCARRDPSPSRVEGCPEGVLSLCLVWAFGVICCLLLPLYGSVVPVFGLVVQGAPGTALAVAGAGLCVWLTVATFRRERRAWWAAVALVTVASASAVVTLLRLPAAAVIEPMGLAPDEEALVLASPLGESAVLAALTGVAWAGFAVFLVAVRRHFR